MIVKELIEKLKEIDSEAEVYCLWDGALRSTIDHAYIGKTGACVLADEGEVAYDEAARPVDAPSVIDNPYWQTPYTTGKHY
ncbi:MAG: hypothetical protein GY861_03920 [bacterium]|nr:hypothetical protein [bacterium]